MLFRLAILLVVALVRAAHIGKQPFKLNFQLLRANSLQDLRLNPINNGLFCLLNTKRDGPQLVTLENARSYYYTNLLLGSNQQKVGVLLDTGSSELWVVANNALCHSTYGCDASGTYNPSTSTSYKRLNETFSIQYVDGSGSEGPYGTDDVSFAGGPGVKNLQFAAATNTSSSVGILGIGFKLAEYTKQKYDNLPAALALQGVINKNLYSLYLDTEESSSGTIIFGGVDNAKYYGELASLPIQSNTSLSVNFKGLDTPKGYIDVDKNFILDSGTTYASLPPDILQQLADNIGAQYNQDHKRYDLDCNQGNKTVTFEFSGFQAQIAVNDLLIPYSNSDGCSIGIDPDPTYFLFGDIILRHLYIVYDLDDKVISLAKVKYTNELSIFPY